MTNGNPPNTSRPRILLAISAMFGLTALALVSFGSGYKFAQRPTGAQAVPTLEDVKREVAQNTKGEINVKEVSPTPINGLYELVTSENDVFYVDGSGRYGLAEARLVDMQQRKDLTSARLDALTRVDFSSLPLDLAIKYGSGSKVLAVFEDATCSVCKPLHKFLMQVPDTTVYVFPYPVISKESMPIAGTVWCSEDRGQAWRDAMAGNEFMINRTPACDLSGLKAILDLGERLGVKGTPTILLENGQRLQGAVPPDQFLAALEASASSAKR